MKKLKSFQLKVTMPKWHNQISLFQKKTGNEDMEFPGVLKKEHVEISGDQLKKEWNFHGSCLGFQLWNFD